MRIAICDDDPLELARLSEIMDSYRQEKKAGLTYTIFSDAMSLLDEMHRDNFDLLLLDVLMPLVNGMQAAHEVRDFDETVTIVFLTCSTEFAVESYAVKAHTYLLKPSSKEALFPILDNLFDKMLKPEDSLVIKSKTSIFKLLFSKLAYVEVQNKTLYFHLTDGSIRKCFGSLSKFEDTLLSRPEFVQTHRSFIVNMWQIQEISYAQLLTYTGKTIPISRLLYPKVREAYMKHLFTEMEVE